MGLMLPYAPTVCKIDAVAVTVIKVAAINTAADYPITDVVKPLVTVSFEEEVHPRPIE